MNRLPLGVPVNMIDMTGYDYAVFDCDGVILDSNHLKMDAYALALKGEPEAIVQRFLAYHIEHGGVSRYHKFRYFYEELNPVSDVENRIQSALDRFADIVYRGMIECRYIPGALEFIESLRKRGLKLFVASGSDEKELIDVFQKRGIQSLFEMILGSPTEKMENVQKIVAHAGIHKRGILFGDAQADADAAQLGGLDFVFVKGASLWKKGPVLGDLSQPLIIHDFMEQPL